MTEYKKSMQRENPLALPKRVLRIILERVRIAYRTIGFSGLACAEKTTINRSSTVGLGRDGPGTVVRWNGRGSGEASAAANTGADGRQDGEHGFAGRR
jgi:hypothetical protein